jgi:UDPglucose 6-dehydrogenase
MKLAYIGTGYVGLVNGTVAAEMGNNVVCVDIDTERIEKLKRLEMPIFEKGLEELVRKNVAAERLKFTTDINQAVDFADVLFVCVGTPSLPDGSADISAVLDVATKIGGRILSGTVSGAIDYRLIVNKSTVPIGTTDYVRSRLMTFLSTEKFDVAMNPEFLREGTAVDNALRPDRVVIGVRSQRAEKILQELCEPFRKNGSPIRVMKPSEAEMVKYASNFLLAARLTAINELANLADAVDPFDGINIRNVLEAIGDDKRIGREFLHPGHGYGGSCFGKDVKELIHTGEKWGVDLSVAKAVDAGNEVQKTKLYDKILLYFPKGVKDKTFAMWGLAFKAGTDDAREAPAVALAEKLLDNGAIVKAYDPEAMNFVKTKTKIGDKLIYAANDYDALNSADALIVCTEWPQFKMPDFDRIKSLIKNPVIFDGKDLYDAVEMTKKGFAYFGIGVENDIARAHRPHFISYSSRSEVHEG